ncbi:MAG TPA: hypothetical protein VJ799_02255, partial [Nitrososphaeraceae archaeon]|nr:hypothetical protein [Nitrososphaeraceae archaeon]
MKENSPAIKDSNHQKQETIQAAEPSDLSPNTLIDQLINDGMVQFHACKVLGNRCGMTHRDPYTFKVKEKTIQNICRHK